MHELKMSARWSLLCVCGAFFLLPIEGPLATLSPMAQFSDNLRTIHIAKYMVSLRTAQPTRYFGDNHFCAGVIIGNKLILTAAHCVVEYIPHKVITRARRIVVVAGTQNRLRRDKTTVELQVEAVVAHEKFRRHGAHDIAILKLKEGLPVDNDGIKMIPVMNEALPVGVNCTALGWGQMYSQGPYAAELLDAKFRIVHTAVCEHYLRNICTKGILCAYNTDEGGGDVCHGDSGGPLVLNEKLVGIISQSAGCGIGYPAVFTSAFAHYSWIRGISAAPGGVRAPALSTLAAGVAFLTLRHI